QLAQYDPQGPWRQIASGITATGLQMAWPVDDVDRQGLLPDYFLLEAQQREGPAINPGTTQAHVAELFDVGAIYDVRRLPAAGLEKGESDLHSSTKSPGSSLVVRISSLGSRRDPRVGPSDEGPGTSNVAQPPPAGEGTPPRAGVPQASDEGPGTSDVLGVPPQSRPDSLFSKSAAGCFVHAPCCIREIVQETGCISFTLDGWGARQNQRSYHVLVSGWPGRKPRVSLHELDEPPDTPDQGTQAPVQYLPSSKLLIFEAIGPTRVRILP
ncbi:MAG: hypothetical protein KBE65_23670, partial [Phycisphaerae bacterium]|nr:hypothetical protein [Phycisphaerae bacterium]